MNLTAKEIIPDKVLKSYADIGLNLHGARHMLEKFLRLFGRTGEVDWGCLFEILHMELDQAREFLKDDAMADEDSTLLNPAAGDEAGQILVALQMMLHGYLSEQMAAAA